MNSPLDTAFSRRAFLQSSGALVVVFSLTPAAEVLAAAASGKPPLVPTELDSWIAIAKDGSVTVFFGKVDGGQGTDLGIAQIVAEELDVGIETVSVVQGDTGQTINQGGASGSTGIRNAGAALRVAGAEARRVLVSQAAITLGVAPEKLAVENGIVSVIGDTGKSVSYAELIGGGYFHSQIGWNKQLGNPLALTAPAKPKTPDQYKVVGASPKRRDVEGKVFGTEPWVTDIRIDGMLHGRVIRPPIPGADIVAVDEASVAGIPGVQVVHKGNFIGVVAPREWDAIKAMRTLNITWSTPNDPFPEMGQLHDHIRNAMVTKADANEKGKVDPAFADAARIIEADYEWPFQSHASIGPGCGLADVRSDGTTVWSGTQKPHAAQQGIAGFLGVPMEKVRVIWTHGPGSYGRNDAGDAAMDAVALSRAVGRPVRVQYMRDQGHAWDPKAPASVHHVRAALDKDGTIVAFDFKSKGFSRTEVNSSEADPGDTLAGVLFGFTGARTPVFALPENAYVFENKRIGWECIATLLPGASPLRTTHMRDPLGPQITFAHESFIDELAYATNSDPAEFRLRYLKEPRDRAAIQAVVEKAGWKPGKAGTRRTRKGDIVTGRGIAYTQRGNTIVATIADVEVNEKTGAIRVPRVTVAHDCGLIVNPAALKRVVEGNVLQSLSRSIHEEVRFDRKGVTSVDWLTYPILDISEAPTEVDVVLLNHPEVPSTGAGEASSRPMAAAIGNAIFEATGARLRRAPLNAAHIKASTV